MNRLMARKTIFAGLLLSVTGAALAQGTNGWFFECVPITDPPTDPYSDDYGTVGIANELISFRVGVSGTVTYGGTEGPCYAPGRTLDAAGRFCFTVGSLGSIQSSFDNRLAMTTGAPADPAGDFCYAMIATDPDATVVPSKVFGDGGLRGFFVGASFNYMKVFWTDADVDVDLQVDVIGDAARMWWRIRNLQTTPQPIGLWFGAYTGMRTRNAGVSDSGGFNQSLSLLGTLTGRPRINVDNYIGNVFLPTGKPLRNERHFFRTRQNFPKYINFEFSQSDPYGIRMDLDKSDSVQDQTPCDEFLVGNHGWFTGPGLLWNNNPRNNVFNGQYTDESADIFLNEVSFLQIFHPQTIQTNGIREIVNYIKSPWSSGNYNAPYTAIVDAPRLISVEPNTPGQNDRTPNPMTIRAYVDNKYAKLDQEADLHDVKFTISLPPGLTLAPGEQATKIRALIPYNTIDFIEWQVVADNVTFGVVEYSIKIEPIPGPTKIIKGKIVMSSTPRFKLNAGASLIALPWLFADTSFDKVLTKETFDGNGNPVRTPLVEGQDYRAYYWSPDTNSYIQASSAERGRGLWIVLKDPQDDLYLNTAQTPQDQARGGYLFNLRRGWNLIGNPYPYAVPLSQLVAVAEDDPKQTFTWEQLVTQSFVSSSLAFWEPSSDVNNAAGGTYKFTDGFDATIEPHKGYWLFVSTYRPIRLLWPAVFTEGLPGSGRGFNGTWTQTAKHWRLQLSARTIDGIDANNFVGVAPNAQEAKSLTLPEPPQAPNQTVQLSVEETIDGQPTRLMQAMTDRSGRKEWKLIVKSEQAGDVTLTWPNLSTVPGRSVRFRLVDPATNTTRDLRSSSGYSFRFDEPGTRSFNLIVEPGSGTSRAVIGNVIVTRPSRDANAPVTISYALTSDANTTIRILSGSGKEVFTVSRGRADRAGQNTAVWTLRDSANRAVAPGSYRVELVAETAGGERVRKIVPVNVIR